MKILYSYQNGNTHVSLYEDGTKERFFEGSPNIIHPESIDVKITDYCDAGCSFCHEQSTIDGQHGDLDKLLEILDPLPAGVEIACGGGNALSHPHLIDFLQKLKNKGIIVNITINQKHLKEYKNVILFLISEKLVYGVGISYTSVRYIDDIRPIIDASDNVVFHVIMGINSVSDINTLMCVCKEHNKICKILVLGYKVFGFGINYYLNNKKIEDNKYQWYIKLASHFKNDGLILSFDNLAIQQMNLKRFFTKDAWSKFYMGDDGRWTCYIDAVKRQYAMSSTSNNRMSFKDIDLLGAFKAYKNS